jgi:lipoprotein-releasing system permease protein
VALIWVIFMMIVVEKTKDIGIIKSVGGSAVGVSMIFLIWAGLIGLIGTVLGGVLGTLFVSNIHGIEQFVSGLLNTQLWDPSAYLFDHIPARFKWSEMLILGVSSVLASMIGALLPAIRAGRMDPIEVLRYG